MNQGVSISYALLLRLICFQGQVHVGLLFTF